MKEGKKKRPLPRNVRDIELKVLTVLSDEFTSDSYVMHWDLYNRLTALYEGVTPEFFRKGPPPRNCTLIDKYEAECRKLQKEKPALQPAS